MNKLRTALRERTRTAHERLDNLFSALDLKRRDDLARFLAAQAAALIAVETALDHADAPSVIPDWAERRRADAIRQDLEALGRKADASANGAPWINGRASILGAAYVLEGSRLGGKMLLKEVLASTDPEVIEATRFLGHGEGKRLWPSFDALLGATDLSEAEEDEMVRSAVETFGLFEACALEAAPREAA